MRWAKQQKNLLDVIYNIPIEYRLWCLAHGFRQFEKACPWYIIKGCEWAYLLVGAPYYADKCDWLKLSPFNWATLLSQRPELACHCGNLFHIKKNYAYMIAIAAPHLTWYLDTSDFTGYQWSTLLLNYPELEECCNWDALSIDDWANLTTVRPYFTQKRRQYGAYAA